RDGHVTGVQTCALPILAEEEAVSIELPAGGVILIHCMTLHACARNESSSPRRAFLPAYRAADALPIYFGPHAAHNEPGVKLLREIGRASCRERVYSAVG